MNSPKYAKWAAAPLLALGLLAGGAAAASAATDAGGGFTPNVAPGSTTEITASVISTGSDLTAKSSTLTFTWQAPPNSVFANNLLGYSVASGGGEWSGTAFNSNACALSNANKTLTCTRFVTVPASSGTAPGGGPYASYGKFHANITVDPDAPYNSTFTNTVSWTSDNGQISPATVTSGFSTPAEPAVPMIDPIIGLGAGTLALGIGAASILNRRRRANVLA
jgi:hypothetical protein